MGSNTPRKAGSERGGRATEEMSYRTRLEETLPRVRETIAEAARRAGREPEEVRIVPVTKGHPLEAVEAILDAGLRDVAENRVGELEEKARRLRDDRVRWHMVGHVQRRKAPRLLPIVHLLHSLDSVRLARRFQRVVEDPEAPLRALVQVNTSGEEAKGGFEGRDGALRGLGEILEIARIRVEGLMTMAPLTDDEETLRSTFRRLREIHEEARETLPEYRGTELSMGMTNDYPIAVEEGSTMVRIGTALFGERPE